MKMKVFFCLLGVLIAASQASADIYFKEYKEAKAANGQRWDAIKFYLLGVGSAYGYANAKLHDEHQPIFFCVPGNLVLERENYVDIIDQEFARRNRGTMDDNVAVDVVLLFGLVKTFPCKP